MCELEKFCQEDIHYTKKIVGEIEEKLEVYLQLLHKQDVRIALLEQQQKLTIFVFSTIFAVLMGIITKMLFGG